MNPTRSESLRTSWLLLFPGALGDFLCFLPTADAIRETYGADVTLVANRAHEPLLADGRFRFVDIDRREVGGLFSSDCGSTTRDLLGGFGRVCSWTGAGDAHLRGNLEAITAGPVDVFRFDAFESGAHAVDRFADCVGVVPGPVRVAVAEEARRWARDEARRLGIGDGTLVVHAGSGSPRKNWQGMGDLARLWRRRGGHVVALVGPADDTVDFGDAVVAGQRIDRVAALLEISPFFVGNDSGIAHLAGAVSCPGIALFTDTDPAIWRPRNPCIRVVEATRACSTCGPRRFCTDRLEVGEVLDQVDRHRCESYRRRS